MVGFCPCELGDPCPDILAEFDTDGEWVPAEEFVQ